MPGTDDSTIEFYKQEKMAATLHKPLKKRRKKQIPTHIKSREK